MRVETSPVLWTDEDVVSIGTSSGAWSATGVSIDSRSLKPGDLFIALTGYNSDGHNFIGEAIEAGAAAIMGVTDKIDALDVSIPVLGVNNTLQGLEDLARLARSRSTACIIAITGSVGKTGTKEALRLALMREENVYATEGNLNNHWGLPLSLSRLPKEANYGVFEMGMSAPKEISPLSKIARPHVAIITQIAEAHSENFDNLEEIAAAKAEVFDGVVDNGTAILSRDHHLFRNLVEAAKKSDIGRIITFGQHKLADARLLSWSSTETSSAVEALVAGSRISYEIGAAGKHLVLNSLSVLAAVHAVGGKLKGAAAALKDTKALRGRGERRKISWEGGSLILIDESYNASPSSMIAAIQVLSATQPRGTGRRIAIIGEMLELGLRSEALHASLLEPLVSGGIDLVFTSGRLTRSLWERLPPSMRGRHANSAKELAPLVIGAVQNNDVTMVKGSFGSRMLEVVEAIDSLGKELGVLKLANGE